MSKVSDGGIPILGYMLGDETGASAAPLVRRFDDALPFEYASLDSRLA